MKVAHRDDYDTHAVIGGNNVQEFGIAQTAEFFTVLSNTLYSNKPLAVIREVLCNAWDAQIVAGRTDRPVIVKIDEDKLSIRDFGEGIPHDLIHNIYCVYGNSTKENDGNQTGGFGLGSKSPFAYSDHFTVVNHHDGLKTVHAISRGSVMTQGKPDRRVMVSVPTTETGVEVIIPVKNREDMRNFIEITKDIASFGEMNVLVNGEQVEVVPISTAENNMFLTTRKPRGSYSVINIRYGNVIYPVQPDPEYIGQWKRLKDILDDIPSRNRYRNGNEFCLILQAPPNSISVTPSRESLSNTETTIKTLRDLFNQIIDHMQTGSDMFEERLLAEQAKAIDHLWAEGYEERVWFSRNLLTDQFGPKTVNDGSRGWTQITNMVEFADYYLRYKEKISHHIKLKLEKQRVEMMLARGVRRPHDLKKYLRIMKKTRNLKRSGEMFMEQIMRPLLRHVAKHPVLNHRALNIVQPSPRNQRYDWADYGKYTPDNQEFLKLLQAVVIVTHNKIAYEEDYNDLTGLTNKMPHDQERIVYVAPRTKGHKEEAIKLFTKLGFHVVDFATMLDEHRAENREAPKPRLKSVAPARPKNIGLVPLSHNLKGNGQRFSRNAHLTEGAERIETYTHVVKPENLSNMHKRFFPWGDKQATKITSLFGSQIGVCVSQPQYESQKKKGFADGFMMIVEEVCSKVLTSPGIRTHVENLLGLSNMSHSVNRLLDIARYSTVLKENFGLPDQNTEDDLNFYAIYESMEQNLLYHYRSNRPADGKWEQVIYDTKEEVSKWKAAPAYALLADRVRGSRGLDYLALSDMQYALRDLDKTNPDYGKKVFIETTIINALNLRK